MAEVTALRRGMLAVSCLLATAASLHAVPKAYIRINQLGYEAGVPAAAYLVTRTADPHALFRVIDSAGSVVLTQRAGRSTGRWGSYLVYPLRFTMREAGQYTIEVAAEGHAASPVFAVGSPTDLYAGALRNALRFYQNERDGPDYLPSSLRTAPSHLNDGMASVYETPPVKAGKIVGDLVPTGAVIDAAGGWWDAGDYLKFVETTSYTVTMLLTGMRDFPAQMGARAPADFAAEAKFGLSWLLKMWDDPSRTLYYEVGIGIDFQGKSLLSDHDLWRLPQSDDNLGHGAAPYAYIEHRPVFAAGSAGSKISPNLAGRLAAAFALGFLQYRTSDPSFAQNCLFAAEHIFDLADTRPGRLLTALPYGFYPETEWRDDLEWGATELDIALTLASKDLPAGLPHPDPGYYLSQAADFAAAYIDGPHDAADTLNLYDVSGLAHFDLFRAIDLAGHPTGLAVSQAALLADLAKQLTRAEKQAATDPFRFGFSWATDDTTSHGAGLSVMANEYANLGGSGIPADRATSWLGNIMGANIWGLSFIVGDGAVYPKCLQHQVANLVGSLSGGTPVLAGAAVEGPNATHAVSHGFLTGMQACPVDGEDVYRMFTGNGARFDDDVRNYPSTEPAIDLTATSPLMFAWRMGRTPKELR
jgi:endoglucanase